MVRKVQRAYHSPTRSLGGGFIMLYGLKLSSYVVFEIRTTNVLAVRRRRAAEGSRHDRGDGRIQLLGWSRP